jgi:hypothetical protein
MKKITKPAQKEEAVYYSDFTGKCFGEFDSHIKLTLDFGYGSKYDGSKLKFDLDDTDIEDIVFLLKSKLSNDTKKVLKDMYTRLDNDYDNNIQARDWFSCNYICNEKALLKKLI